MRTPLFFLDSEARILDSIRHGDEAALAELYNANRKTVLSYVLANHGTADDADDLLQEALVVLWERVRSGTFQHAARLSTFLFAVAKNQWLRHLARRRHEVPLEIDEETAVDDDPSVLDRLIASEQAEGIGEAMRKLDPQCRELLLSFYWDGLTTEEISQKMGFANADVVKSKKYQCKKKLESLLQRVLNRT